MKRFLKILGYTFLSILLILVLAVWLVSTERVQNFLAGKATTYLAEKLQTRVEVGHIRLSFFNRLHLENVYIEDRKRDTLAYIGDLAVQTSDLLRSYRHPVIRNVELNKAHVFLNRAKQSEAWNYSFIAEAFGGGSPTDTSESKSPASASAPGSADPFSFDLHTVHLLDVVFFMDDAWRGEDLRFAVQDLKLGMKEMNLPEHRIAVEALAIHGARILVREYEGGKPEDLSPPDSSDWGTPFNPDHFSITMNRLQLSDCSFSFLNGDQAPEPGHFDEAALGIEQIAADIRDLHVVDDTLLADIRDLQALERSGLQLRSLQGKLHLSQVLARLSDMRLQTAYSEVGDFFEMRYRNFHDFKDFLNRVSLGAKLNASSVSSLDIAYFAPILRQYPITVQVSGEAEGIIPKLEARSLELSARNTSFSGNGTVTGLPDIERTLFDINVDALKTSGTDLNALIPQTRSDAVDWKGLSAVFFSGRYSGFADDFRTTGKLQTTMGDAALDLHFNFRPDVPQYSGKVHTAGLDVGRFIKQKTLGRVALEGEIDGKGFSLAELGTKLNATVPFIEVNGETYRDLTVNGLVANRKFDGIFLARDPRMSFNFNGKLDLSGKEPSYNFQARLLSVDFQKLGFTPEPVIASGYATMDFQGNDIDHFTGMAELRNMELQRGDQLYQADYLKLESIREDTVKTLRLESTLADAELRGQFTISELPRSFQVYLYHYLPEYISKPLTYSEEAFTFDIHVRQADSLLRLFRPELNSLSNIYLSGDLNTRTQRFSLDAQIPEVGYGELKLNEVQIVGAGDFSGFDLTANGGEVQYSGDLLIPSFQLVGNMAQDTASLSFNSQSINEVLGEASLNCRATAQDGQLYVTVLPSNISIRNDQWQVYCNHYLVFGDRITVRDLIAESGAQRIVLNSKDNATNDLTAKFRMIDLEGASKLISGGEDVKIFGRVNGQIDLIDYRKHPLVRAELVSMDALRFNRDTVGHVMAAVVYDVEEQQLNILKPTSVNQGMGSASIEGMVGLKDSVIRISTLLDRVDITPVGQFISDYVSDLDGSASGNVSVNGRLDAPDISGRMELDRGRLKVLFLGTRYSLEKAQFNFNNRRIDMNEIVLRDERDGNYSGKLSGQITHRNFSEFYLNFRMQSENLLCMNTGPYDNDLFYGYVPARVNLRLLGPLDDITVDVDARPLKGARFHLPINSTGDISTYDYIQFATVGRTMDEDKSTGRKPYYMNLSMNIDATPDAEVFIVLDANTGEEIRARGNGAIKLNVDLGNSISMFGNYVITNGKYLFNFRGLIPREFAIDEGSRISWSGDALDASLDVKAIYKLPKNLPLFPLVSAQYSTMDASDQQEAKRTYATFVNLMLKGSLSRPDIRFDITQPENKAIGTAGYTRLEQIKNDEKELVSQAGVLLLLGEFKASDGITNASYSRGSISTVSDMVSSALSNEVTNLFQKLTGLKNISFNMGYQNYGADANTNLAARNEFKVNVSANLFKDRVIVDFGNSVDVGRDATGRTTGNYMGGDFKAQFLLSEDGRFRATAYRTNNTNNLDVDARNFTKSGAGLSYRKVFNQFSDLFTSRKKKKARQQAEAGPKNDS